ncbi:hypothetical protein NP233_g6366 [Leucocoprinus birnbaumii]|uniref:Uncharacterized protein n=1 Tax=Leucocoprinus birnbaumii TaxID=56174 RepID=A0AAD5VR34_9AGAR|nr:hypothetical protein NP233_g6366 [Leucocoprinus birnbaumii]
MFSCNGCPKSFRRQQDYILHGQQSNQISCQEAYQEFLRAETSGDSFSSDSEEEDSTFEWINAVPVPFEGHMFSLATDYHGEDFGQMNPTELEDPMDVDYEDLQPERQLDGQSQRMLVKAAEALPGDIAEEEKVAQQEDSWEPARPAAPQPLSQVAPPSELNDSELWSSPRPSNTTATEDDSAPDPLVLSLLSEARRSTEHVLVNAGHGPKPKLIITYSDKYPRSKCGAPIAHSKLLQQSANNVYAPFNSKVDWEIACWAKL